MDENAWNMALFRRMQTLAKKYEIGYPPMHFPGRLPRPRTVFGTVGYWFDSSRAYSVIMIGQATYDWPVRISGHSLASGLREQRIAEVNQ